MCINYKILTRDRLQEDGSGWEETCRK